jgi:hypothetical protein
MRNRLVAWSVLLGLAPAAHAQYRGGTQQYSFNLKGDGVARQEWTRDLFGGGNQDRWRLQARPRVELGISSLLFGVGGEFNYSKDENTEPLPGAASVTLLRDNYKSRDARLDLAFLSIKPAPWLHLQGGRFEMPFGLTEMIWDKDIRPQGGAITLEKKDASGARRYAVTGLYAEGSHVFDDEKAQMFLGMAEVGGSTGSLTGSYIEWRKLDRIEPMIRRQNTRVGGEYVNRYRVVDGVARVQRAGQMHMQLVVDYCRNLEVDEANQGIWVAAVLGSLASSRARLEYTYASVDKDATLAAYATDDFFWATGWAGHRTDFGFKVGEHSSLHGVAQWQRFKDSPREEERDHWLKRYRLELRVRY